VTYRPAKKLTATIAGIGALALVLTACSSSSTSSTSTSSAASSAAATSGGAASGGASASGSAAAGGGAAASGDYCTTIKSQWPDDMTGKTIDYYTTVSPPEDVQWKESFKPFEECTGATVQWNSSKEFEAQIKVRVSSGNPPDIAAFPQPGLLKSIVESSGTIVKVPQITSDNVDKYYNAAFKGYGTVNGNYFASPGDASVKSFVWYSPKAFTAAGYTVPTTYDELVALSDKIAATGKKPWCAGIGSGDATGWPATDWLEDFMVRENGPDVYQQWVNHEIPFNDPKVAASLAKVGKFLKNPDYVNGGFGGVETIASTTFQDGGLPILKGDCFLHRQASFYGAQWPAGTDVSENGDVFAFYLPTFNDEFGKPVLGAGTFMGAFNTKPEVQALQYYLTTPDWSNAYVAAGTNITANNALDEELIKTPVGKLSYDILQDPDAVFVFDGSDQMPGEIGAGALWKQLTAWIATNQSDQVTLDNVEAAWPTS
jgi:alpha-glucoside transport system substrate-binding protein